MNGVAARAGRLFDRTSGRSFMVAFDRTLAEGPVPHGEDARSIIGQIVDVRPQAVVLGPGLLKHCGDLMAHAGAPAPVVRLDFPLFAEFTRGTGEHHRVICEPAEALALGAEAGLMFLVHGFADGRTYADNVRTVAQAVERCRVVGLPLIVETVLWGADVTDPTEPKALASVCRIAAELGADIVKTQYTGDTESMRQIVDSCPVPVTVLGGPSLDSDRQLEDATQGALKAGVRGVIYGRNIWQRDDLATVAARVANLIHT